MLIQLEILVAGSLENQSEVESLVKEVEYYKLVSHLTWALWGIISVSGSVLQDISIYVFLACDFNLVAATVRKKLENSEFFAVAMFAGQSVGYRLRF